MRELSRVPGLAKLFSSFPASDTGRLKLGLTWQASEKPQQTMQNVARVSATEAKKGVTPCRRSSVGWIQKKIGTWSVGVGRRHPVTIRKRSSRHRL